MYNTNNDTAVVILSYNGWKWHKLFLPLIVKESVGKYDVFIIDHASTDHTAKKIKEHFPMVTLISLSTNKGFSWGYAQGLKQISAKYYVLLSADFEVTTGWFNPLHHAMEINKQIAACQPKIKYYKDKSYFEYAGAAGGFMDQLGYLFCRGRIFDTLEQDLLQYDDPIEVFWASGGCLMVRSRLYHVMGGLDEALFAHMEEVDLCWRFKNAGYKIGYIPTSTVYHVGGSVISYGSPEKTFYNFRNNLLILLKNEVGTKLIWLLPLRLFLDGIAGLQLLAKGQVKNCFAIIRAHVSFYTHLFSYLNKRKTAKTLITRRNKTGIYKVNIIIDYFFKKRKTFTALNLTTKSLTLSKD